MIQSNLLHVVLSVAITYILEVRRPLRYTFCERCGSKNGILDLACVPSFPYRCLEWPSHVKFMSVAMWLYRAALSIVCLFHWRMVSLVMCHVTV